MNVLIKRTCKCRPKVGNFLDVPENKPLKTILDNLFQYESQINFTVYYSEAFLGT